MSPISSKKLKTSVIETKLAQHQHQVEQETGENIGVDDLRQQGQAPAAARGPRAGVPVFRCDALSKHLPNERGFSDSRSRSPGRSMRNRKTRPAMANTASGSHTATGTGSFCRCATPTRDTEESNIRKTPERWRSHTPAERPPLRVEIPTGMPTSASTMHASGHAKRRCSSTPALIHSGPRYAINWRVFMELGAKVFSSGGLVSSARVLSGAESSYATASLPISCVE